MTPKVKPLKWEDARDRRTARVMGVTYVVGANLDGTFFSYCDDKYGEVLAQSVSLDDATAAAEMFHRKWVLSWLEDGEIA